MSTPNITYTIDRAASTVNLVATNEPSIAELVETLDTAIRDPGYEPAFEVFTDREAARAWLRGGM